MAERSSLPGTAAQPDRLPLATIPTGVMYLTSLERSLTAVGRAHPPARPTRRRWIVSGRAAHRNLVRRPDGARLTLQRAARCAAGGSAGFLVLDPADRPVQHTRRCPALDHGHGGRVPGGVRPRNRRRVGDRDRAAVGGDVSRPQRPSLWHVRHHPPRLGRTGGVGGRPVVRHDEDVGPIAAALHGFSSAARRRRTAQIPIFMVMSTCVIREREQDQRRTRHAREADDPADDAEDLAPAHA